MAKARIADKLETTSQGTDHDASYSSSFRLLDQASDLIETGLRGTEALRPASPNQPELSIVIPVFNERETLPTVIERVEALPITKQIVIVNDASTDGTTRWLKSQESRSEHTVIHRRRNRGKGSALRCGFRHCTGKIITIQDADLEYDPADLMHLIRPIQDGECDVAYGSRYLANAHQDPSFIHRLGNRVLTEFSNATTGLRLTDMETCYKAFRSDVLDSMPLRQCRFGFEPEVTAKIARRGNRVKEVAVGYNCRSYEEGKKIGWRDGVNALYCMLRYSRWD